MQIVLDSLVNTRHSGSMVLGVVNKLTNLAQIFLQPSASAKRQYEALRAFFVEHLPARKVAQRFGYTYGSFRVLCHQFRQNPRREFFQTIPKGPRSSPKRDPVRQRIIALRKQNYSIYDIQHALQESGHQLSAAAISQTLTQEGFSRLPRRADAERPPALRPTAADVADVRQLSLEPRSFRTRFGGLFLLVPSDSESHKKLLDKLCFPLRAWSPPLPPCAPCWP